MVHSAMQAGAPPPPPPPPSQRQPGPPQADQADEEIACLRTIVQCLAQSLVAYQSNEASEADQLSFRDTQEFLELITSLLESNPAPPRLWLLALDGEATPVHVLLSYLRASPSSLIFPPRDRHIREGEFVTIQVQCIQTLTSIMSLCCTTQDSEGAHSGGRNLKRGVFQLVTSIGAVDCLFRMLSDKECSEPLRTAAAECLFVFTSRIDEAKEAMVRLQAVPFLFDILWKEQCVMVRNYTCAMIRVVAEQYSEQLLNIEVIERSISMLQHEQSKYVAILLLDVITMVFTQYNAFYLQRIHSTPELVSALARLCEAVLCKNFQVDVVTATVRLAECIVRIEGTDSQRRTAFLSTLLSTGAWKSLVGIGAAPAPGEMDTSTAAAATAKLECFRVMVEMCTTKELVDRVTEEVVQFFPSLSLLLNAPLDEGHSTTFQMEVALTLVLLLAKHPDFRRSVRTTIIQYSTWADALKDRLFTLLDSVPQSAFDKLFVIDVNQVFLNNPSAMEAYGVKWWDMESVSKAVHALIKEQEEMHRKGDLPTANDAMSPVERLAAELECKDPRAPQRLGLTLSEKRHRLTHAIFSHVVAQTLMKDWVDVTPRRYSDPPRHPHHLPQSPSVEPFPPSPIPAVPPHERETPAHHRHHEEQHHHRHHEHSHHQRHHHEYHHHEQHHHHHHHHNHHNHHNHQHHHHHHDEELHHHHQHDHHHRHHQHHHHHHQHHQHHHHQHHHHQHHHQHDHRHTSSAPDHPHPGEYHTSPRHPGIDFGSFVDSLVRDDAFGVYDADVQSAVHPFDTRGEFDASSPFSPPMPPTNRSLPAYNPTFGVLADRPKWPPWPPPGSKSLAQALELPSCSRSSSPPKGSRGMEFASTPPQEHIVAQRLAPKGWTAGKVTSWSHLSANSENGGTPPGGRAVQPPAPSPGLTKLARFKLDKKSRSWR